MEERGKLWTVYNGALQFKNCSVNSRPFSKLAPLPNKGHRKSMKLMCDFFYLHCRVVYWLHHSLKRPYKP